MQDPKRVEAIVHGYVQGVGFRWSTREVARRLNLRGYVRNRHDRTRVAHRGSASEPGDRTLDQRQAYSSSEGCSAAGESTPPGSAGWLACSFFLRRRARFSSAFRFFSISLRRLAYVFWSLAMNPPRVVVRLATTDRTRAGREATQTGRHRAV